MNSSNRYTDAFAKFRPALTEEETTLEVEKILSKYGNTLHTVDNIKFLHSVVDLTSLSATDHDVQIMQFVEQVNALDSNRPDIPHVAAICVYPNFVSTVKNALSTRGVNIAAVSGGFPSSQTFPEVKVVETGLAVEDGADEIDIVLHVGNFLSENYEEVADEILELREVTKGKHLKVILETGALKSTENIRRASILSLFCDADFIKTSTGKEYPGATLNAAYTMATVLKQYAELFGEKRGLKVSGGVRTTEDALRYLAIVKEVLGDEWLTPDLFRIGASSLVADLQKEIGE